MLCYWQEFAFIKSYMYNTIDYKYYTKQVFIINDNTNKIIEK